LPNDMDCWPDVGPSYQIAMPRQRDVYKLALITPKEWLEPGHGIMCRSCRFHQKLTPYHMPNDGPKDICSAKECHRVLQPERGYPGLVLYHAGNETCAWYEPEIVLNIDLSGVEARLLQRLCDR